MTRGIRFIQVVVQQKRVIGFSGKGAIWRRRVGSHSSLLLLLLLFP